MDTGGQALFRDRSKPSPKRLPDIFSYSALALAVLAIVLALIRSIPPLKNYIPSDWTFSDGIVGFMSLVITSLYFLRNEIKTDTTKIIELLEGVEFRHFQSGHEQMLHVARQINRAATSVCDVSWVDYLGPERLAPERKSAQKAYDDAIAAFSAEKPYREIFIVDGVPDVVREMRLDAIRQRLKNDKGAYYCAYLPKSPVPQMQFLIVDDEVIFRGFDKDVGDVRCSIQHPEFSRMFRAYYARLWRSATVLRDEKGINKEELRRVTGKIE
jgi:hypothetical protein